MIFGPTGVGKSQLAIELAHKFDGEVISMDSMQVYDELDILTNKVTPEEARDIPHHLMSLASPNDQFTAFDFVRLAEEREIARNSIARKTANNLRRHVLLRLQSFSPTSRCANFFKKYKNDRIGAAIRRRVRDHRRRTAARRKIERYLNRARPKCICHNFNESEKI
jgi:DNA polymerase III delta prime subunit